MRLAPNGYRYADIGKLKEKPEVQAELGKIRRKVQESKNRLAKKRT